MDRLNEIENEIKQLETKIEALNTEKTQILKEANEKILIQNWQKLQDEIRNIQENQIYHAELNKQTNTVALFDAFYKQAKPYLKLGFTEFEYKKEKRGLLGSFYDYINYSSRVSLILIKSWNAIRRNYRTLTPTILKKYCDALLTHIPDNYDLRRLFEEINSIPKQEFETITKTTGNFERKYYPLSKPISLGAQINKNLEGFGNEYCGNQLVYEGTKYGETTEFLIVGVCVDNLY